MRVTCISTDSYLLSNRAVRQGDETRTCYQGVSLDQGYLVYGIILYEDGLRYLLYDAFGMPNWYPAELFEVVDSRCPSNWYYRFLGYDDSSLTAIWGYEELVSSDVHYDELCEQDPGAVELFTRKKREIDDAFKNV